MGVVAYAIPPLGGRKYFINEPIQVLFGHMVEGAVLYKLPYFGWSKIFVTLVFWRLRNHTFDGHISRLEQDRDNLKPLLPTKHFLAIGAIAV